MGRELSEILKEALALPADARAALADSLLGSLDRKVDESAYGAWEREIERRIEEVEAGKVRTVPWSDARVRLMSHLRGER